jgi:hypothetical protein
MNKTIGYWAEKLLGYISGLALFFLSLKYNNRFSFIHEAPFLDKVISISSTLFGFLLAILTLILQGNSPTVNRMKLHGSYKRLITLNKFTVISAIIACVLSFILTFSSAGINTTVINTLASINLGIFVSITVNTLLFTLIFYKIVIADQ